MMSTGFRKACWGVDGTVAAMGKRLVIVLLVSAITVACATSPTGRRQLMIVSEDQAIAASRQAYAETVEALAREGKIASDPKLKARVDRITGRLVAQAIRMRPDSANWEWSVKVIDDPEVVNAWCMAGGRMALYTGLVQQIRPTDDELAQVMGHEIAHALANHTAEKMSVAMASSLGVAVVGAATDNSGLAATGAAAAALLAIELPNSRTAESEADRIGIELAAKAGYDPRAAITLWDKMGKLSAGGAPLEFLSTHPGPERRMEKLARLVPEMMPYYEAKGARPVYRLN